MGQKKREPEREKHKKKGHVENAKGCLTRFTRTGADVEPTAQLIMVYEALVTKKIT